ncbi:MAG: extracellular solute-binding protein, partial [Anaerolineae bacterium]|nr:extracellular solute-binding protein [Anaerolineae bacterium]
GWEKTWAFLKDIDPYIEYYPSRTGDVVAELANGTRAMMVSTMGWDINPRVLGNMPPDYQTVQLEGTSFVADAQFMVVPKGLDNDHLAVVLDLMAWMLKPDQQAIAYDKGYFYPGPAVKDVDRSMAPEESQQAIKDFGRPEYDDMAANTPVVLPLAADNLVKAFAMWDEQIGGNKIKIPPTAVPTPTTAP